MQNSLSVTPLSLVIAFGLVVVAMLISGREKLGLNKDIIIAMVRMVIQLVIVGYALTYIFQLNSNIVTSLMMLIMIVNAAWNAHKRAGGIDNSFQISLIAIFIGVVVAISVLVLSGSLQFIPSQMIPITGMLVGSAMNVLGLSYRNLNTIFKSDQQAVLEKLALGADIKLASKDIITESIKGALQPTIDTAKTVGLVTLPGMMTGMMFAGTVPTKAIMYQILVYFMLIGTASMSSVVAVYLSYKQFYNDKGQLQIK